MSSKETSRTRRATRANTSGASSSSNQNSAASRPVRSTRLKTSQVNLADDTSEESGSEEIKPISSINIKKTTSKTNGTSSTSLNKIDPENITKLESITGLSKTEATQLLEASNNNLEQAIELHFSNLNGTTEKSGQKSSLKRTINHVEESNSCDSIYNSDDNVRAPILPKSEKMLDYDPYALAVQPQAKRVRSAFDGYRPDEEGLPSSSHSGKAKSLAALYKPPVELLFKGSFESSKIEGSKKNRWIMLNVQDQSDFTCQCLNRDLWREDTVKEIIKANFVFVQVYFDSLDGKKMINYYRINTYPFIAIIDPRTGENVMQFQNTTKLDQFVFCEKVTNFLCEHEMPIKDFEEELENGKTDEIVQIDDEDSKDCVVINEPKTIKASELIKELNGDADETSNSSEESVKLIKSNKNRLESSDEESDKKQEKIENYQPKMLRYETPDTDKRDCVIRILYPNGDRLDYCTNGDSKFKDLAEYLKKQGYKKKTHELIERLMPNIKPQTSDINLSQTSKISNDLSNLLITNQSRNLFNLENDQNITFKELNLFPRVFLLLQEY